MFNFGFKNNLKINIRYGKLLDPFFKDSVKINYPDYVFPNEDEVLKKVELFKEIWSKEGGSFINEICRITKLKFKRNTIDCFIITATPKDLSAPLVIRSRYNEQEFLDSMYHELVHILLTDNNVKKIEEFKNESSTTINHIHVFAILKYFYIDVLRDESKLVAIKQKSSDLKNVEYKKAWDIVERVGYREIIEKIKKV